jgi:hypothetical protein
VLLLFGPQRKSPAQVWSEISHLPVTVKPTGEMASFTVASTALLRNKTKYLFKYSKSKVDNLKEIHHYISCE